MFEEPLILLPGDEFILDCWTNSSSRDFATTGGESSSQEMCFAFLFYYPAMDLQGVSVGKTSFAMETWMKDAQNAGYLNGTADDIDDIFDGDYPYDFTSLYYDSKMNGAEEFYNRLYSVEYEEYNQHNYYCYGTNDVYNTEFDAVARSEEFVEYDLNVHSCSSTENKYDDIVGVCAPSENTPNESDEVETSNQGLLLTNNLCMIWIISLILVSMA